MVKTQLILMVTAAGLVLAGCSHGGRGGPPGGMMMGPGFGPGMGPGIGPSREQQLRRFDANADGEILRDEFMKVIAADYAAADLNQDGKMTNSEALAFNAKLQTDKDVSPIIDWDGDGTFTQTEFAAQWRTLFERADADHDGVVTARELARPPKMGPGDGPPRGGPGGPGRPGGGPPGRGPGG